MAEQGKGTQASRARNRRYAWNNLSVHNSVLKGARRCCSKVSITKERKMETVMHILQFTPSTLARRRGEETGQKVVAYVNADAITLDFSEPHLHSPSAFVRSRANMKAESRRSYAVSKSRAK